MRNVPTGHFTLHSCKIFFHRNVKTLGFRNYFHIEICQVLSIMVVVNQLQPSMMTKVINPVSKIVDREKIIVRGAVYRYFVWLSLYSFATSFPLFIVLIKWSNVNVPSQFLRNSTLIFFRYFFRYENKSYYIHICNVLLYSDKHNFRMAE